MSRAHEIQATEGAPSPELQARVMARASELGVTVGFERRMVEADESLALAGAMAWYAVVTTARGRAEGRVRQHAPTSEAAWEAAWEEALSELGLFD